MQISVTRSEGLKRELKVVVPAGEISTRFSERLETLKGDVQLKGFRKGKVPVAHLKKMFGRSLMAEVVQQTIEDTTRKALTDRSERPAMQPKIDIPEDREAIERVLTGESDLAFGMSFEVLPEIVITDLSALKLERKTADVDEAAMTSALEQLVERAISYTPEEGAVSGEGDRVTINFAGKIDGEPFEGGSAEGAPLVIGKGGFIPGFEDGLKGLAAGQSKEISVTFPADYPAAHLAGKAALFDVTVTEVAKPARPQLDDAFAKTLGADTMDALRGMVTTQLEREYERAGRSHLKRALLDQLEGLHTFELPAALVEQELEGIIQEATQTLAQAGKTLADEGKTPDDLKAEYRGIAERRVRLGLVIGEIGEKNKIDVNQEELRRALIERARRFPGQEKMVYEYYERTPGALNELRAPIFEEKVVDFIVELAKPASVKVSREELFKAVDESA